MKRAHIHVHIFPAHHWNPDGSLVESSFHGIKHDHDPQHPWRKPDQFVVMFGIPACFHALDSERTWRSMARNWFEATILEYEDHMWRDAQDELLGKGKVR